MTFIRSTRVLGFTALALSALLTACGPTAGINQPQIEIKRPQYSGPHYLVCGTPNDLREHVGRLTRNQLFGIVAAAYDGDVRNTCDDTPLPVGTTSTHSRWMQTQDGWWVLARTVVHPNGGTWVAADPYVAQYGSMPPQYRLGGVIVNGGIFIRTN